MTWTIFFTTPGGVETSRGPYDSHAQACADADYLVNSGAAVPSYQIVRDMEERPIYSGGLTYGDFDPGRYDD